jgi:protein dithiol:quinone oxidoreductase
MKRRTGLLLGLALLSTAAVAAALFTQHVWDMQPCPWCILQRVIFLAIAALCLLALPFAAWQRAAALPFAAWWQRAVALPVALLALGGVAAAAYQHFVAAQSESCALSWPERFIATLGLDALWPQVFVAYASCQDAAVTLLGLPYEAWSGLLFLVVLAGSLTLLLKEA